MPQTPQPLEIKIYMSLQFSHQPGCWERHLQRQYNNPLFIEISPIITQHQIEIAQQKDQNDRHQFIKNFHQLLEDFTQLKAQEESEQIFELQGRVDKLYSECAVNGNYFQQEKQGLKKLSSLIYQAILNSGQHKAKVLEELEQAEIARKRHFTLLENSVIAHLLREDSPIAQNELVPTLLSEDKTSLQAAMSLFDPEQQQTLYNIAKILLERLQSQNLITDEIWQRLAIMWQALSTPNC